MAVLDPPPGRAARLYAAARAALNDGRPSFGVRVLRPGEPTDLERARAAYNDPSAYPLPDPGNWLSQLASMDPKSLPKHVQNWLAGMATSAAQDPMSTVLPFLGSKGAGVARAALVGEEGAAGAAELSQKMKGVNQYLGQRRTEFAAGLEPPPTRSLPVKQYTTENVGPRQVSVTGEIVHAPERITLEQARVAGVEGPVPYETPRFRFTRQGPRVEVTSNTMLDRAASGDNASIKFRPAFKVGSRVVQPEPGDVIHADILDRKGSLGEIGDNKVQAGFVDGEGNFYDREAASRIAVRNNMMKRKAGSGGFGPWELAAEELLPRTKGTPIPAGHVSIKVPKAVHSELGLDDPSLVEGAYPSLKIDAQGNATVHPDDLKYMLDDATERADPQGGFETAAHRRKALREWVAVNKGKK